MWGCRAHARPPRRHPPASPRPRHWHLALRRRVDRTERDLGDDWYGLAPGTDTLESAEEIRERLELNEQVMVLRVIFPPGRGSNYHLHSLDQISVLVEAAQNEGQELGKAPTMGQPGRRGNVGFTDYSKKPFTHRSTNKAQTPFHNVVIALTRPQPGGFAPAAPRM